MSYELSGHCYGFILYLWPFQFENISRAVFGDFIM